MRVNQTSFTPSNWFPTPVIESCHHAGMRMVSFTSHAHSQHTIISPANYKQVGVFVVVEQKN